MQTKAVQFQISQQKAVLFALIFIGVLAIAYVVLVNQTVHHVVERRSLEAENSTLASRVSELEFTYMRHKNVITPGEAFAAGFNEAQKVTYISRTPAGTVLTLNR